MGFVLHGNTVILHVRPVGAGEDEDEGRWPLWLPWGGVGPLARLLQEVSGRESGLGGRFVS